MSKKRVYAGMIVGSSVGSFVPALWHAGIFSMSAVLLSTVGGIAGIWVAWRMGR